MKNKGSKKMYYEYEDDHELDIDDEDNRVEADLISDEELLRLHYCAQSSKLGMADKGFPNTMRRLAAVGFVTPIDGGYKVTTEGLAYLKLKKDIIKTM